VDWEGAMDQAYNYYVQHEQFDKAGVVIEGLTLEHPLEKDYYEKAANIYGKLNSDKKALFYFRKAFGLGPSVSTARFLFVLYFRLDQPVNAMPYLDYAIANGGGAVLSTIKKRAEEIVELEKKPSKGRNAYRMIAEKYNQMGNKVAAEKYLQLSQDTNESH
jgi:tetratricopeptide (TPR) repeat protein